MTTRLKAIGLMARYLIVAALLIALILYLASLIAERLDTASQSDGYNIRIRTGTYEEVQR